MPPNCPCMALPKIESAREMHANRMRAFPFAFALDWSARYRMEDVLVASLEASEHAATEYDHQIALQHAEAEAANAVNFVAEQVLPQCIFCGTGLQGSNKCLFCT